MTDKLRKELNDLVKYFNTEQEKAKVREDRSYTLASINYYSGVNAAYADAHSILRRLLDGCKEVDKEQQISQEQPTSEKMTAEEMFEAYDLFSDFERHGKLLFRKYKKLPVHEYVEIKRGSVNTLMVYVLDDTLKFSDTSVLVFSFTIISRENRKTIKRKVLYDGPWIDDMCQIFKDKLSTLINERKLKEKKKQEVLKLYK